MSDYQFNAEQTKVIEKMVADCLAATHRLYWPDLKGPYVEKAREYGFTIKLARIVADKVMDALRERYKRERSAENCRDWCCADIEDSLEFNELPTDELIKTYLTKHNISVTSWEVKYMHTKVLYKKAQVFRKAKYRYSVNGDFTQSFGNESSVKQVTWTDTTTYRGEWKGRKCIHLDTYVVYNKNFVEKVYNKGLAFSGRYIVLEARKVRVTGVDGAVYKVKYVYQNPKVTTGLVVQMSEGYLKVTDDERKYFSTLDELKNDKKKVKKTK